MMIYLDDMRSTPEGWHRCFKIEEVQELMQTNVVTHLSLDHDLGASYLCKNCFDFDRTMCDEESCTCMCHSVEFFTCPTGYDLCKWMAELDCWPINKPMVHSANPVGARNMRECIERYWHAPGTSRRY
jgi:hypothetical protein